MENITITLLCTIGGIIFSYLSFNRHQKRDLVKDTKVEVSEITNAVSQLKHISDSINDIRVDLRQMNTMLSAMSEKVIRLETIVEQLENRIDKLEGK